jgi:hypothetical protein
MRKSKETFERDNLVVETIRGHIGKENAISGDELFKILNDNGYHTTRKSIVAIVERVIEQRYLPICSLNGKGYYFPKCKDDIESAIAHLQLRVDGLNERIKFLKQFMF